MIVVVVARVVSACRLVDACRCVGRHGVGAQSAFVVAHCDDGDCLLQPFAVVLLPRTRASALFVVAAILRRCGDCIDCANSCC